MKLFLMTLFLVGVPHWLSAAAARAADGYGSADKHVVIVREGKALSGHAPCVISTTAGSPCVFGSGGDGTAVYAVAFGDAGGDGRSEHRVVRVRSKEDAGERGWLGVSIGRVSDALAAQLDIEGRGIVVLNVVEDSPADHAGIEAHDIILSIGGDDLDAGLGPAVDLIKSRKPGDEVEVVVLRDGREKALSVRLGSRADLKGLKFEWKFEVPDAEMEERIRTVGRILRKGADDQWIIEDLGDLDALKDLPKHIRMLIPKSGSRSTQVFIHDDEKKIKTKVERDGGTIVITREDDGPIIVTRTDKDGKEETAEYDSEDELREADEEAYEIWENVGSSVVIQLKLDGLGDNLHWFGKDHGNLRFDFDFDLDAFTEHAEVWKEHMEEWAEQWSEKAEEWKDHLKEWKESQGLPDDLQIPPLRMFFGKDGRSGAPGFMAMRHPGKPTHKFDVQTDGTIEVSIRKGDSELVRRYEDEDELARQSPKLYEKYQKLMALEDQE